MWPLIKRWQDWAMHELWPLHRSGTPPQALSFSYEKAGLVVEGKHIPWNADGLAIEAWVRMPAGLQRSKGDFSLRFAGQQRDFPAADFRRCPDSERWRLLFHLPVPPHSVTAEILQRHRLLGQISLPVISEKEFFSQMSLQLPTLYVRYKDQTVPCQAYVSTQCQGLVATALLVSPTNLLPLADQGLRLEVEDDDGAVAQELPITLSRSQLLASQTLITVVPRKPRRMGAWQVSWRLGKKLLASQPLRAVSRQQFLRSLHVPQARFVATTTAGEVRLTCDLPENKQLRRAGPCFLVATRQAGLVGLCSLQVRAQVAGAVKPPLLQEQEMLITDAPTPLAPGTLDAADLAQVTSFELRQGGTLLSALMLAPLPTATFTGEGGFKQEPANFHWTAAAEDQFQAHLNRLLKG